MNCSKVSYPSKKEANDEIQSQRMSNRRFTKSIKNCRSGRKAGKKMYPYECECGSWHLTTIPPKHYKKMKAVA